MIDYHTHSYRCGHGTGTMEQYVQRAVELGLREIGLSDHFFHYFRPPPERVSKWAMAEEEFRSHYDEMCHLRWKMRDHITVRIAVEVDYVPGHEDLLRQALEPYQFDYVLGGVHFLDDWMIDDAEQTVRFESEEPAAVYQRYYEVVQRGVQERAFDVLAHFDLPKKFGFRAPPETAAVVAETLDCIRDHGVAVEVSTGGLRKPVREIYPSVAILQQIRPRHIPVVLASDAHAPAEVGYGFTEALELLRDLDFAHLTTFAHRKGRPIPFSR